MPERRLRKSTFKSVPKTVPELAEIAVPYLLKSLSANYRNRCPEISERSKPRMERCVVRSPTSWPRKHKL